MIEMGNDLSKKIYISVLFFDAVVKFTYESVIKRISIQIDKILKSKYNNYDW